MSLAAYSVWIIDDDIPVQALDEHFPQRERFIRGTRPLDHGALTSILYSDRWEDEAVRDVCKELLENSAWVSAFTSPSSALAYVNEGGRMPDVIIYDVLYDNLGMKVTESDALLCQLLAKTFSLAQVYTKEGETEAQNNLATAYRDYAPRRLAAARKKTDCNAADLLQLIQNHLQQSFPSNLCRSIRNATSLAVERTLVGLDDLYPLPAIAAMLGSKGGADPISYQELTDFVVRKVGEYLEADGDVARTVRQYAATMSIEPSSEKSGKSLLTSLCFWKRGAQIVSPPRQLTDAEVLGVTSRLIEHIVATIRDQMHRDRGLVEGVLAASKTAAKQESLGGATPAPLRLSKFVHSWLYSDPVEELVGTGDILSIRKGETESLYFVVTPPCDLVDFWRKTRSCLTVLKVEPATGGGKELFKLHQPAKTCFSKGNLSVVSGGGTQGPVILPSVRVSEAGSTDYILFSHRIESLDVPKPKLPPASPGGKETDPPAKLTIPVLQLSLQKGGGDVRVTRVCRVSEPFLTPLLNHISNTVFQNAFPDLPADELARINTLLG